MIDFAMFCPALSNIPKSEREAVWFVISNTWPYNLILIPIVAGLIYYEIKTRNGTHHYNSKNGYSPNFNRIVGKVTYYGIQVILPLILSLLFGDAIYCMLWPYIVHAAFFFLTWFFLNKVVKFWVY
jgi:hypothetical protein